MSDEAPVPEAEDGGGDSAEKSDGDSAETKTASSADAQKDVDPSEAELTEEEVERLKKAYDEALEDQELDRAEEAAEKAEKAKDDEEDEDAEAEGNEGGEDEEKGEEKEKAEGLEKEYFTKTVNYLCIEMGMKPKPTEKDLEKAFEEADNDGGGTVDFEEFLRLFTLVKQGKVNGLGAGPMGKLFQAIMKPKKKDPKKHYVVTLRFEFAEESKVSFTTTDDGDRPRRLMDALEEGMGDVFKDRIHRLNIISMEPPNEPEPEPEPEPAPKGGGEDGEGAEEGSDKKEGNTDDGEEAKPDEEVADGKNAEGEESEKAEGGDGKDEDEDEDEEEDVPAEERPGVVVTIEISGGLENEEMATELAEQIKGVQEGILDRCKDLARPNHTYTYTLTEITPELVLVAPFPPEWQPKAPSFWAKCCGITVAQSIKPPPLMPLPVKALTCDDIKGFFGAEELAGLNEVLHANKVDGKKVWSAVWQEVYREREELRKRLAPKAKLVKSFVNRLELRQIRAGFNTWRTIVIAIVQMEELAKDDDDDTDDDDDDDEKKGEEGEGKKDGAADEGGGQKAEVEGEGGGGDDPKEEAS